ncbi:MAG: hypothetical protein RLZZ227_1867, partial [Pseudomonadota bacterium]
MTSRWNQKRHERCAHGRGRDGAAPYLNSLSRAALVIAS